MISALQKLRSTFPLKVSVEKINKKRIYWSDIQINSGEESTSSNNNNNNNNSNGSNKKQKKEYNVSTYYFHVLSNDFFYIFLHGGRELIILYTKKL